MLLSINTELTSLRDRFTKMESQLLVTRRVKDNLITVANGAINIPPLIADKTIKKICQNN